MGEIRQFLKVGEVVAVKEIKLNNLTNIQSASVFMFLMFKTYSRVCSRATRELFVTNHKGNPQIQGFTTCINRDSRMTHELYRRIVANTSQHGKIAK